MTHKRYFFLMLSLILVGAGCNKAAKKAASSNAKPNTASPASLVWLPPAPAEESPEARNLKELRAAIAAFQGVKSFRADLHNTSQDGTTSGKLEVMKPDRFHGIMTSPKDNFTSEAIGVGSDLYIRVPKGPWQKITSQTISQSILSAFKSAVDGDQALIQSKLPNGTKITKRTDAQYGCERYTTAVEGPTKNQLGLEVCIARGLPKIVSITQDTDTMIIEYSDYNSVFTIERPLGK